MTACQLCPGDGWRTLIRYRGKHRYEQCVPCVCTVGNEHRAAHRATLEGNDSEIGRLGYRIPLLTAEPTSPPPDRVQPPPRKRPVL
jgi:hypothetical protein